MSVKPTMSAAAKNGITVTSSARICDELDRAFAADPKLASRFSRCPAAEGRSCRSLITFVTDRPGQTTAMRSTPQSLPPTLGTRCSIYFEAGLHRTVNWYIENEEWWRDVTSGAYEAWIDKNYRFRVAV